MPIQNLLTDTGYSENRVEFNQYLFENEGGKRRLRESLHTSGVLDSFKISSQTDRPIYQMTYEFDTTGQAVLFKNFQKKNDGSLVKMSATSLGHYISPKEMNRVFNSTELVRFLRALLPLYQDEVNSLGRDLENTRKERGDGPGQLSESSYQAAANESKKERPNFLSIINRFYEDSKLNRGQRKSLDLAFLHHQYLTESLNLGDSFNIPSDLIREVKRTIQDFNFVLEERSRNVSRSSDTRDEARIPNEGLLSGPVGEAPVNIGANRVLYLLPEGATVTNVTGYGSSNWEYSQTGRILNIKLKSALPESTQGKAINFNITLESGSLIGAKWIVGEDLEDIELPLPNRGPLNDDQLPSDRYLLSERGKMRLDKEIAEESGVLGALRNGDEFFGHLGSSKLNDNIGGGIGGLIGAKGNRIGSGGLGSRGSGLGGGGTAEGLGGLGTKGRGSGNRTYGRGGGGLGRKEEGRIGPEQSNYGSAPEGMMIEGGTYSKPGPTVSSYRIASVINPEIDLITEVFLEEANRDRNSVRSGTIKFDFDISSQGRVENFRITSDEVGSARLRQAVESIIKSCIFPSVGGVTHVTDWPIKLELTYSPN